MAAYDYAHLLRAGAALPVHRTELGALWAGDCMALLPAVADGVIDTVFADPPFNVGKLYGASTDDALPEKQYLDWCRTWVRECVRIVKPGGAFFLYNLPKWNVLLGAEIAGLGMEFRHWIAIESSTSFPITGKLHPSHYSLLYYTKGKPKTFRKIRTPIQVCRSCSKELKDYGGHRAKMHPKGVNLKDVWTDIPPVRHRKFKTDSRRANSLSTKLLDRVVELSTRPGDVVFDPFGGSGTTYAVCETKGRHWLGTEIDFCDSIVERLRGDIEPHPNDDWVEPV